MAKKHQVYARIEFDDPDEAKDFIASIRNGVGETGRTVHVDAKIIYTHCKLCGRSRSLGTLGSGLFGYPADECGPAHYRSCQKRQMDRIKGEAQ